MTNSIVLMPRASPLSLYNIIITGGFEIYSDSIGEGTFNGWRSANRRHAIL